MQSAALVKIRYSTFIKPEATYSLRACSWGLLSPLSIDVFGAHILYCVSCHHLHASIVLLSNGANVTLRANRMIDEVVKLISAIVSATSQQKHNEWLKDNDAS